jgi:hypothetical protein
MEDNQSLKDRLIEELKALIEDANKELTENPSTDGAVRIAAAIIDVSKALAKLTYGASNEVAAPAKPFDRKAWAEREKAKYRAQKLPNLPPMDEPEAEPNPLDDILGADDTLADLGEGGEGTDILDGGIEADNDKEVAEDAVNPLADKITDDKPKGKG